MIVAHVTGPVKTVPGQNPVYYQVTQDDRYLIERLVSETLNRLTVVGLTSRPKTAASEFARKQMAERLKALPTTEVKATEKPSTQP